MHEDNLNGTGAPKNHFGNHVCSFGPSFVPCSMLGSAFAINYLSGSYLSVSDIKKKTATGEFKLFAIFNNKKGGGVNRLAIRREINFSGGVLNSPLVTVKLGKKCLFTLRALGP